MNNSIQILDCTLRDGGYVNNWEFGEETIYSILSKLIEANIDIIECGFLSNKKSTTKDISIYNDLAFINQTLATLTKKNNLACMINFGEVPIENLPVYNGQGVDILRIAFHKQHLKEALDYCRKVQAKGYKVFVQPMVTSSYDETELDFLIQEINSIGPQAAYIVDSFGTMRKNELLQLFQLFDLRLNANINIGFHSHNNLQLAFSNAQELIQHSTERTLIIDSSAFGMGRGAGNLCSELLILHLNENRKTNYRILPILEIIDRFLNPIFIKKPWGYSVPFYLASANNCHPNYASYLTDKQTLNTQTINFILSQIPAQNKSQYNAKIIEELYINYQSSSIDDAENVIKIKQLFAKRNLLILAPGKSLESHKTKITQFISENSPLTIAINFIPHDYNADIIFISNFKRFSSLNQVQKRQLGSTTIITTSNIKDAEIHSLDVDYTSLIDPNYKEFDNAGIMFLRLLQRLKICEVTLAGFDGFQNNPHENYFSDSMINSTNSETLNERNKCIAAQLKDIRKNLKITFLTPSLYTE